MAPAAFSAYAAEMRGRVLPQRFWPSPFMPTKGLKPGHICRRARDGK